MECFALITHLLSLRTTTSWKILMNNKIKARTLIGNPTGNLRWHVLTARALNMCSFGWSERSIESRCVVMGVNQCGVANGINAIKRREPLPPPPKPMIFFIKPYSLYWFRTGMHGVIEDLKFWNWLFHAKLTISIWQHDAQALPRLFNDMRFSRNSQPLRDVCSGNA